MDESIYCHFTAAMRRAAAAAEQMNAGKFIMMVLVEYVVTRRELVDRWRCYTSTVLRCGDRDEVRPSGDLARRRRNRNRKYSTNHSLKHLRAWINEVCCVFTKLSFTNCVFIQVSFSSLFSRPINFRFNYNCSVAIGSESWLNLNYHICSMSSSFWSLSEL